MRVEEVVFVGGVEETMRRLCLVIAMSHSQVWKFIMSHLTHALLRPCMLDAASGLDLIQKILRIGSFRVLFLFDVQCNITSLLC